MLALCFPVADYGFELRKENSTEAFVTGTADSGSYSEEFVLDAGVDYELYVDICGVVAAVVDAEDICDELTPCDVRIRPGPWLSGKFASLALPCFVDPRLNDPRAVRLHETDDDHQSLSRTCAWSGRVVGC